MTRREQFLRLVWDEVINSAMAEHWIDNSIRASELEPNGSFSDEGEVVKRLLALGASRRDLSLLVRSASYEAAFSVLYMLGEQQLDMDDLFMLHEELLMADPTGMEGRPGSAPGSDGSDRSEP